MGEHGPDCDCGHHDNEEDLVVTLTLEDGSDLACEVVAIFPVEDKDYIALAPINETLEEEVILFRFKQLENDEAEIINIEDDDEYEAAIEAYEEIIDDSEWDDIISEDI